MSITSKKRGIIRNLAGGCCEYCRITENNGYAKFQIDHIIPQKHGGTDEIDNLCLACVKCNSYKGSNVAALDPKTQHATRLYDPRHQIWDDHFQINPDGKLVGKTPEGRVTIEVLRFNEPFRVQNRYLALQIDEYPCQKTE